MSIISPFEVPLFEILDVDYRISRLTDSQRVILFHLANGKSDAEIASLLKINVPTLRTRLASACDRAGVFKRAQLLVLYGAWRSAQTNTEYRSTG